MAHRIHKLAQLAKDDPEKRFDRLLREVARPDFLIYAYEQIEDNKGSNTPGIDGKTKRHFDLQKAAELAASLRSGTYSPNPVKRVYIRKKSGKLRPLGIPTFADRVVQSAIKLILEALYEPLFLDCSHGFRPAHSCHTALLDIYDSPNVRIDWVVEGDIQGFFDNVNHQILMKLLHKRIRDDRFLRLIAKFLKVGYFEREMWNPSKKGTPQGGISALRGAQW
ncbi:MAG: reverse transcriptase domain-containing protein [Armatimonadota bacterium]